MQNKTIICITAVLAVLSCGICAAQSTKKQQQQPIKVKRGAFGIGGPGASWDQLALLSTHGGGGIMGAYGAGGYGGSGFGGGAAYGGYGSANLAGIYGGASPMHGLFTDNLGLGSHPGLGLYSPAASGYGGGYSAGLHSLAGVGSLQSLGVSPGLLNLGGAGIYGAYGGSAGLGGGYVGPSYKSYNAGAGLGGSYGTYSTADNAKLLASKYLTGLQGLGGPDNYDNPKSTDVSSGTSTYGTVKYGTASAPTGETTKTSSTPNSSGATSYISLPLSYNTPSSSTSDSNPKVVNTAHSNGAANSNYNSATLSYTPSVAAETSKLTAAGYGSAGNSNHYNSATLSYSPSVAPGTLKLTYSNVGLGVHGMTGAHPTPTSPTPHPHNQNQQQQAKLSATYSAQIPVQQSHHQQQQHQQQSSQQQPAQPHGVPVPYHQPLQTIYGTAYPPYPRSSYLP